MAQSLRAAADPAPGAAGAADLENPADAVLHFVLLQQFAVMKQQADKCRLLLAQFQEKNKMTLPPDVTAVCSVVLARWGWYT